MYLINVGFVVGALAGITIVRAARVLRQLSDMHCKAETRVNPFFHLTNT